MTKAERGKLQGLSTIQACAEVSRSKARRKPRVESPCLLLERFGVMLAR